MWFPTHDKY
ncbi:hypothetical protein LINPERPRIM_LOCUS11932 [Linum perenne]